MGGRRAALVATVVSTAVALSGAFFVLRDGPAPTTDDVGDAPAAVPVADADVPGTSEPPPDPSELPSLGVQFHGTWTHYDRRKRSAVLDRIEESGATWVRLDLGWAMLQPERGRFDRQWAVPLVDEVMAELERRDLKVLVMFWLTPGWATVEDDDVLSQYTAPDRPRDYASALGWVADRWGGVVDAWEVWNEPNLESFFIGTDPATYTELLCAAYPAVRRADPRAQVVLGGLMFNDDAWLQRAYEAGAGDCFDVLAVHSYQAPADAPPSTADEGEVWNLAHLDAVHQTMAENGDGRLPVWITEFGWSVHDDPPGTEEWRRGVTEEEQAAYAAEALRLVGREYPYVQAAFWYKDAVNPDSTDEHQEGYALLGPGLRPRPVLAGLAHLYGRR